jgi:hypothetical protein
MRWFDVAGTRTAKNEGVLETSVPSFDRIGFHRVELAQVAAIAVVVALKELALHDGCDTRDVRARGSL